MSAINPPSNNPTPTPVQQSPQPSATLGTLAAQVHMIASRQLFLLDQWDRRDAQLQQELQRTQNSLLQRRNWVQQQTQELQTMIQSYHPSQVNAMSSLKNLVEAGILALKQRQYSLAISLFTDCLSTATKEALVARLRVGRANAFYQLKQFPNALADCNSVIYSPLATNKLDAFPLRGRIYIALKNPLSAIEDLTHAIQLLATNTSDQSRSYVCRGLAHMQNKNFPAALRDYNIALDQNQNPEMKQKSLLFRGKLHLTLENLSSARDDLSQLNFQFLVNQCPVFIPESTWREWVRDAELFVKEPSQATAPKTERPEESATLACFTDEKLLELCRVVRGESRAASNCTHLASAVLKYLTKGEWPQSAANEAESTLQDHAVLRSSVLVGQVRRIRQAVAATTLPEGELFDALAPQSYDADYAEHSDGAVDVSRGPTVNLDEKEMEPISLEDANDRLKKEARSAGGVSVGLIDLRRAGAAFQNEPGHLLAYHATPQQVRYIDPQFLSGGVVNRETPPVFEKLDTHFTFASQTTSLRRDVFGDTIFYLPLAMKTSRKRAAVAPSQPTAPQKQARR